MTKDWTQFDNIADKNAAKLKELQELFWQEADKYQVLPLDNSMVARAISAAQPERGPGIVGN